MIVLTGSQAATARHIYGGAQMQTNRPVLLVVAILGTALLPARQAAAGKKAEKTPPIHQGWANPQGVLVSTDGGKINPPEQKDKSDGDPIPPSSLEELGPLLKTLTAALTSCLAALREATAELQQNGARYAFNLDFVIGEDGQVGSLNQVKTGGSKELPACATRLAKQLGAHAFKPPAEAQPLGAHIEFEAVILNDNEAQGRGYQYIMAEKAWEASLKVNKSWFRCEVDTDCVTTAERCEVRGVNKADLPAYRAAINNRKKPPCQLKVDLSSYKTSCRSKRCVSRKNPRSP